MAISQNVNLGQINRLRGAITIPSTSGLNLTANCLTEEGILVEPEGGGGELLPQMTGGVVSLKPYVFVRISFGVLRTLSIGATWYQQWLLDSAIGDLHITPVTSVAPTHYITNSLITGVGRIAENGSSADLPIVLTGTLILNSSLWSAA
jgi:hypothetical protein